MYKYIYNLICIISFLVIILIIKILSKSSKSESILRYCAYPLLFYKIIYYVMLISKGNLSLPVEISSITYFLVCIVLIFKIKTLYCIASFFGMISGIGYFLFHMPLGFLANGVFTIKHILIGCLYHGYVLITGVTLYLHNSFNIKEKDKIWITILAMLCWGLAMYDVITIKSTTFIYYLIKPKFLLISSKFIINALLVLTYYIILILIFNFVVKKFFSYNTIICDRKKQCY